MYSSLLLSPFYSSLHYIPPRYIKAHSLWIDTSRFPPLTTMSSIVMFTRWVGRCTWLIPFRRRIRGSFSLYEYLAPLVISTPFYLWASFVSITYYKEFIPSDFELYQIFILWLCNELFNYCHFPTRLSIHKKCLECWRYDCIYIYSAEKSARDVGWDSWKR